MARVLVISGDMLPVEGQPTSGAGLRAWGLGKGLESCGHDVKFALSHEVARKCNYEGAEILLYDHAAFDDWVENVGPEILIFQHWPTMGVMRKTPLAHVVVDFHGPLLLETLFRDSEFVERAVWDKLERLSKADYFTCAGTKQMYYYLGWLLMAGVDLRSFPISAVPFSLSPDLPVHSAYPADPVFVYGGNFLPWQDPILGLTVLTEEMEKQGRGNLHFFGGKHPWLKLPSEEQWDRFRQQLTGSQHVCFNPAVPRDELINRYTTASVAWDVMARNPEREMAFTSRTVEYLWCGLPVVYNDYAELSTYIREYDAGWIVDPTDEAQLRATVRGIYNDPAGVRRKGENAQKLVRERLSWDVAVKPLDDYCRDPQRASRLAERPLLRTINEFQFSPEVLGVMSRMRSAVPLGVRGLVKNFARRAEKKQ